MAMRRISRRGFAGLSLRSLAAAGLVLVPELRWSSRGTAEYSLERLDQAAAAEATSRAPQAAGYESLVAFLTARGFTRDGARDEAVRLRGDGRTYVVARSSFRGASEAHITTLHGHDAGGAVAVIDGRDAFAAHPDGSIVPASRPSLPARAGASGRPGLAKPLAADCCALWSDCIWYNEAC